MEIKIGGKTFKMEEVVDKDATAQVEDESVKPVVEDTAEEVDGGVEEKIDEAAEKVVAKLGLDKIMKQLDEVTNLVKGSKPAADKKLSALMDLEALMKKDVNSMSTKEKIIGFFQAMVQSNHAVMKALSEGTAADGGYLFPDEFRAEVIKYLLDTPSMRNYVTVIPMKRDVMNIPTLASRPTVTWTQENAVKSTTSASFDQATLTVKKMAAILYASDELIEDSTEIDVVNFIIGLFADAIGVEEDRVIWRGNGTTEPTGIVTAQAAGTIAGISGATGLSVDLLLDLIHALPQVYQSNAKLYAHRNNIKEMRKLKSTEGIYYWTNPQGPGMPPSFLGYDVVEVNHLGEGQIYFGDLKKTYWLGDRQKMTVKVTQDTETAFTKDQTAIRVVSRIAGNVVLGQACRALTNLP